MEPLLVEIGAEEITAGYIQPALDAFSSLLVEQLDRARIGHGEVRTYGTPRRLAVMVDAVAPRQESLSTEAVGPPAARRPTTCSTSATGCCGARSSTRAARGW